MRQPQTEAERALWQCLRGHRLLGLKFRRQKVLGPYIVDFVCHERMLVIELDGGQHVGSPADAWLESRGPGYCGSGTTRCWRAGRCCWRSFSCCRRFLSREGVRIFV
ncbi:endonuclease domain-containing protein [Pseudomonas aeruginosa]|uniref:endonuclease domain-containing protein n=1 Tax=Pseudomonas aeruginosa TaxID=287 RepID=UPI00287057D8|nr:endonuclease domain-containing protein [Pseudomonas aeruginosa]